MLVSLSLSSLPTISSLVTSVVSFGELPLSSIAPRDHNRAKFALALLSTHQTEHDSALLKQGVSQSNQVLG